MKAKITKRNYLKGFFAITALLALVRVVFPSVAGTHYSDQILAQPDTQSTAKTADTIPQAMPTADPSSRIAATSATEAFAPTTFYNPDGSEKRTRVRGVASYRESFPDLQDVQLEAAKRYGVSPVANREDAEHRKSELVYIGSNPYYDVRKLSRSIPYLVPRAAVLLQDIACNFFDSLQVKHVPINKFIISSVLRTKEDVEALRRYNHNATENSCHLYGTTFDIAYNHYTPVTRAVRNDTLKWVLSEVLDDLRKQGRCYVKHENKQGCFHITVK